MNQILDAVKAFITPEFLEEGSKLYEETEIGIAKTISSLAPAIMLGLMEKGGDSHAIYPIFNSLRDFDATQLAPTGRFVESDAHTRQVADSFLSTIFGAKTPAITHAIASFSGVKPTTAAALLHVSTPWVMNLLRQKIRSENLNAGSLVSYLLREKNTLMSLIPANVGGLLGMAEMEERRFARPEGSRAGNQWFWWMLLLIGLLSGLVIWLGS